MSEVLDPVDRLRQSQEYKIAKKQMADRLWRLNHLYYIQDKDGHEVQFKMKAAQLLFYENQWYRDIICKARQIGFCLSPTTAVLTADLEWVSLDDIQVGQEIMSCDEESPKGTRGISGRKLRKAVVEKKFEVFEQAIEIVLETGTILTATPQHRFLCRQRGGCLAQWRRVSDMKVGDVIRAVTDRWDLPSYEDGWFGGLLDGEGSMRQKPSGGYELCISQVEGPVLERARRYLKNNHISFNESVDRRKPGEKSKLGSKPVHKLSIYRAGDGMRLLGKCRPSRFNRQWWDGRKLPGDGNSWVKIASMRILPPQRMIDLQTSTKTFIAEGFVSHNSTEIALLILDDCLFRKNTRAAIIDATLGDAKKKLAKIKFAYDRLSFTMRSMVRLKNDNTEEMKFTNGSEISIGTSFRGDTPQILLVSELGKISLVNPEAAKGIRTGAYNAVGKNGKIYVESTAHGTDGEFYDQVERAKATAASGRELTSLDFKLHFFAWWMDPEYRLPANSVIITQEMATYFTEMKAKYGITLDPEQRAWYAKMHEEQGPDDMKSEYPSCIEECFHNSLQGTYFKREMTKARLDQRIGLPLPFDPSRPVNTFWDIGMDDENCIIFHQTDGVRHRFIDFYKNSGEGLPHYVEIIRQKQEDRKFIYGKHFGPHDLKVREWTSQAAKPRFEIAKELGVNFVIVPRIEDKADAIEAARRFIQTSWFDSVHCGELVKGLDNYRKKWNKTIGAWASEPVHDFASHIADALMTGSVGLVPDRVSRAPKQHRFDSQRTGGPTSWSA